MRVLGLTGGIGMGKSTMAALLRRAGLRVFDADAQVRALQAPHGRALPAIEKLVPGCVRDGVLDRAALRRAALADPAIMRGLEGIVHPLVRVARTRFLQRARRDGCRWVVLDIPLLFETGAERICDKVVVVSAPAAIQRARVLRRGTMTPAQLDAVLARQMPDAARRRRADIVIETGLSRHDTLRQVRRLLHAMHAAGPAALAARRGRPA
ncbi:dephospho-CoA kinase [Komagataeibacter nataicola]|uniref:Dephospho-CoA kinase n=1 Tax=Komagataeibacter nataicola TaxID=265960 RepID=A0A9N7CMW1_9PROT|nr:dephospho-CoA kinase [Komagataeibacter nataicola]AQU88508.1 dephospho-CoA kinase [Komagataeibacter nataicola]PYD67205.1 dephospho-CoA kinase [Komagataeibacter nataicola]WEQ57187.1 dephospho-CoA kinase [Komagataeibacter nataicola]WNM08774.1 dephospho-CoA kinase [Komagataeibacter nataicola]GBR17087.1 dephospho-CoA kinase [Komagataeibacter nataicola NRIC 0616]